MTGEDSTLSIRGLGVCYGSSAVLDGIDLADIPPGTITALVGPNGAGKSTLLRALAGLAPASGTARWNGRDLLSLNVSDRAKVLGFMPQGVAAAHGLTVLESVIASLRLFVPLQPMVKNRDRALSVLVRIGLADLAMRPLARLSGGQRQLASLAQSLVRDPEILLLDEPTSALDLRHQIEVMTVLRTVAESGRIVIVVLHDLALAANWADRLIFLNNGRLVGEGRPVDVLTPDLLRKTYRVDAEIDQSPNGKAYFAVNGLT